MTTRTKQKRIRMEVYFTFLCVHLALRILPSRSILAWASSLPRCVKRFSDHEIEWVLWAVEEVGHKQLCLPRALVVQSMLRRRGIRSTLNLGVADKKGRLLAHAWVQIEKEIIIGKSYNQQFVSLAQFGNKRSNATNE